MALDPNRTEHILNSAMAVFYAEGYGRASMDLIARQAGVSKATLYNHFATKAHLFRAAVQRASESFVLALDTLKLDQLPLEQALISLGRHYLDFLLIERNLSVVRAVIAETQQDPDIGQSFHAAGPAIAQKALAALFKRRIQGGEMAGQDPLMAARHFIALLRGDLFWRGLLGVPVSMDEREAHIHSAARQFLRGAVAG